MGRGGGCTVQEQELQPSGATQEGAEEENKET